MNPETPEEFWYQAIAKYKKPLNKEEYFPENLVLDILSKTKQTEICVFVGECESGENIVLTYPKNAGLDNTLIIKNFIGVGIGTCEYESQANVGVYPLDYYKPMTDDFFLALLQDSYHWEIKDYGDLSIY